MDGLINAVDCDSSLLPLPLHFRFWPQLSLLETSAVEFMPLEQGESKVDFSCISPKFLVHFVTDFSHGTPEPSSSSTHSSLAFES